jgi:hypothetical protein
MDNQNQPGHSVPASPIPRRKGWLAPISIMVLVVVIFGGRYTEVIAAWLHDVIEDCAHGETTVAYGLSSLKLPGDDAITVDWMAPLRKRPPRPAQSRKPICLAGE